jgi:hypothetical protein
MGIAQFSKIAPYLANPLVLIGFCLFLSFGVYWALIKSHILSPLSPRQTSVVVRMFLRYGLWVSILMMIVGGILAYQDAGAHSQKGSIIQQADSCGSNTNGDGNEVTVTCEDKKEGTK